MPHFRLKVRADSSLSTHAVLSRRPAPRRAMVLPSEIALRPADNLDRDGSFVSGCIYAGGISAAIWAAIALIIISF